MQCRGWWIAGWSWLLVLPLMAAEPEAGVTTELLEGESLRHWVLEHGGEVDFVDGNLRLKAGDGWLRSQHEYRDFVFVVETKALQAEAYDAGIYIRSAKTGAPFPKPSYQVNLLQGKEGNIGTLKGAASSGLAKPAGEWNKFEIRVVGSRVAVKINDQPAYDVEGVTAQEGYIGFQIEVPKGGQFLVRKATITELGSRSLFNGRDLTGWEGEGGPAKACWSVDDGQIVCSGAKGPWLRSSEEFGEFNLRFDYQLAAGGNSGIYVHVPRDGLHHREHNGQPPAGFEVQLLDDAAPQYAKLKDYQHSASVYDIRGAWPRISRPAGEWNSMEINRQNDRVVVVHNGHRVVDVSTAEQPGLALRKTSGFLGLQNHSTVVRLKNLRISPPYTFARGQ